MFQNIRVLPARDKADAAEFGVEKWVAADGYALIFSLNLSQWFCRVALAYTARCYRYGMNLRAAFNAVTNIIQHACHN